MLDFLLANENLPFTVALAVMFGIAVLEGVMALMGFALSGVLDSLLPDMDFDIEADVYADLETPSPFSRLLGWLRVGKVPMLMLLIIFLTGFGLIGLLEEGGEVLRIGFKLGGQVGGQAGGPGSETTRNYQ